MTAIPKDLCNLLIHILEDDKPYFLSWTIAYDSEQIEILDFPVVIESLQEGRGPQYAPYFLLENVLGIPKKVLVKAYIIAKNEFFEIKARNKRDIKLGGSLLIMY